MVRSGRRSRSAEALGQALLPDTISFLFAASECRFMEVAFCLTASGNEVLIHERTKSAAAVSVASDDQMVVRLGFDLFEEVRYLLTQGQPAEFASIPTLDLHISSAP